MVGIRAERTLGQVREPFGSQIMMVDLPDVPALAKGDPPKKRAPRKQTTKPKKEPTVVWKKTGLALDFVKED